MRIHVVGIPLVENSFVKTLYRRPLSCVSSEVSADARESEGFAPILSFDLRVAIFLLRLTSSLKPCSSFRVRYPTILLQYSLPNSNLRTLMLILSERDLSIVSLHSNKSN
ncbi:unnamed protein product [Amoebophrya sp. A120]|nr:unnamed protein product [Amoebophrya sp. A120]|eukprot:GSA120T00008068001.1